MNSNSIYILFPFVLMFFCFLGFLYGKSKNKEKLILGSPGPGKVKSGFYDKENNYIRSLTLQIGDLIHYQEHDYKRNYPKNAEIYSKIGTILKYISSTKEDDFSTVEEFTKKESFYFKCSFIEPEDKEFLNSIKKFNSVMLIDLAGRMQGKQSDDVFLDCVQIVTEIHLLCKAPFNECVNLRVNWTNSCENCLSISDKLNEFLESYCFHYENNKKFLLGISNSDDYNEINFQVNALISSGDIEVNEFFIFKNETECWDFLSLRSKKNNK